MREHKARGCRRMRNSPVATPNPMPFTSAGHPAVFGVRVVEELAGERYDSLSRVPAGDPGAFGAAGCVVDGGAAPVGRGCGGSGAFLGELLGLAICVPGEWVGLLVRVVRVVVRCVARDGERATLERVEAQVDIVTGAGAASAFGTTWSSVAWDGRGMVAVVVVVVVVVGMWWWHPMLLGGSGGSGRVGSGYC